MPLQIAEVVHLLKPILTLVYSSYCGREVRVGGRQKWCVGKRGENLYLHKLDAR